MSNTVTLSAETLSVLKKLYDIDQSLRIVADNVETVTDEDGTEHERTVLRTKSHNRTMMSRVHVAETFPRDVNLYDLREFISVVNLVSDHEIDFSDDNFITIKSTDDKQTLRYLEANPDMIGSYIAKDIALGSEDVELLITQDQLKSVINAANTMKLGYVGFFADGKNIEFTSFDMNNGDEKDTKKYSTTVGETDIKFRMFYNLSVHNIYVLQGEGDLTITIDGKRKISEIKTASGKTFWIAMDDKSSFEG